MRLHQPGSRKQVLILGAGSAGLSAALKFRKTLGRSPDVEVTLVDEKNHHFYRPLLYQVVTGSIAPSHIYFPLHGLLRRGRTGGRIKFRRSRVEAIDISRKTVTAAGGELTWDFLVVALGSTANFFGMSDVEEHALPFRSLKDGVNVHNRIVDNFEAALLHDDERFQRELLTFVVVGGGPTGVELAASIQEYIRRVLGRDYPQVLPLARVILVEAQDTLLSTMRPELGNLAVDRLRSRGVEVMLNTRIGKTGPLAIETSSGEVIPTRMVVWTAGVKPVPVVESLPFEKARDGRIIVNEYLEVPDSPGVYALGDCAYVPQADSSGPYPATHQAAVRQGPVCAENILSVIKRQPQRPFKYRFVGQVMYIDRNAAVADLLGRVFDGCSAGTLRRLAFIAILVSYPRLLTGIDRKLDSALEWLFAYFYHRNNAHLE